MARAYTLFLQQGISIMPILTELSMTNSIILLSFKQMTLYKEAMITLGCLYQRMKGL